MRPCSRSRSHLDCAAAKHLAFGGAMWTSRRAFSRFAIHSNASKVKAFAYRSRRANALKRELRIPQLRLMALLSHRETQNKEREWAGSK